jgi:hypothetical protein
MKVNKVWRPAAIPLDEALGPWAVLTLAGGWGVGLTMGLLVALGTGWLLGVGFSGLAAGALPTPLEILPWAGGAAVAMLMITVAQWGIVERYLPPPTRPAWITRTAIAGTLIGLPLVGIGIILGLGGASNLAVGLNQVDLPLRLITVFTVGGVGAALGAAAGALLGVVQWAVLRHHDPQAHGWIPANSIGGALGLGVVLLGIALLSAALRAPLGSG